MRTCSVQGMYRTPANPPLTEDRVTMALGRVKWFNDAKGYGFIEKEAPAADPMLEEIFVHYTAIQGNGRRTLEEGQEVEFDIYDGPKGKTAQNVFPRA